MTGDANNAALIARILEGARWATLLRLGAQVISWASTLVVVRFVSTADYGLNAMLESSLDLLFLVSTLGLDLALVRARALGPELIRPAFGGLLVINGLLFCAYFFGSPLIASYFGEPRLQALAQALAFVFLLVPFRVIPNAILDRELKFRLRAVVELVCTVVAALTALVLAVLGFGVWALVTGVLVNRALAAVLLMALQPWIALPSWRLSALRGLLREGGSLTLASALATTAGMFPVLIGGPSLGPAALGLYAVATQFAMLPLSKVMPIVNSVAFPAFSKFEGQPAAVGGYVAACLGTGALLLLPVMVGLACASEAFTRGVLGEQWGGAAHALAMLSLVMPLRGIGLFLRQVLGGVGRADLTLKANVAAWFVCLGSVLVGARFGIDGLVAAFAATEIVGCGVTVLLARSAMHVSPRDVWVALRAPVTAVSLMGVAVLISGSMLEGLATPLMTLLAQVAVGAVSYALTLALIFRADVRRQVAVFRP